MLWFSKHKLKIPNESFGLTDIQAGGPHKVIYGLSRWHANRDFARFTKTITGALICK